MEWIIKSFNELLLEELYEVLKLRAEVFVVEQACVYNDIDDLDKVGIHVLGYNSGKLAAYARILPANTRFKTASIGRVVTEANYRGKDIGKVLMQHSIDYILNQWNESVITISAQEHLEKFYGSMGFLRASESYLEDGIPHIKMTYK